MADKKSSEEKRKEIQAQVKERQKTIEKVLEENKGEIDITPAFVKNCFQANELGDGALYAA